MSDIMYQTKFSEATTIGVLSKLKKANVWIETLHDRIGSALDAVEALVFADPTNKTLHGFYLSTLEIYRRDKSIGYIIKKNLLTGIAEREEISQDIRNNESWTVSIVSGGKNIRVHLTEAGKAKTARDNSHLDITFY